jgi:hypothetical protein
MKETESQSNVSESGCPLVRMHDRDDESHAIRQGISINSLYEYFMFPIFPR